MGRHLTFDDRLQIEALYTKKVRVVEIAEFLGFHRSTIYDELKRGYYERIDTHYRTIPSYSADIAQAKVDFSHREAGVGPKIGNRHDICKLLSAWLLSGYSPAVCSYKLKIGNYGLMLSTNTIYSYIKKGYIPGVTMKSLPYGHLQKKKDKVVPKRRRAAAGLSIEHRPPSVSRREDFGHWEMDCVIGKATGSRQALLTMIERKSRYMMVFRLPDKTSASVTAVLDDLYSRMGHDTFTKVFQSITCDNGSEFADCRGMQYASDGRQRTTVYYCHPYCSSERGSNENHNRMLRRFFAKGASLFAVSQNDCNYAADWCNNLPRRILHWETPAQVFDSFYPVANIPLMMAS